MFDEQALLRAIIENPDDDSLRLVYADLLEERGEAARAALIRVQVERAQLPPDDLRQAALQERDRELRRLHEERWRAELPALQGILWQRFWRGFVSGADVQGWKFFRRHADAIFAATPVQFLRLHGFNSANCRELVKSPYLGRLRGLDLNLSRPGNEGVCALAGCAALANLRTLALNGPVSGCFRTRNSSLFTDAGAFALVASPYLCQLERLGVWNNELSEVAVRALRERFGDRVLL